MSTTTKINIPGIGNVTVEEKPELAPSMKIHDTFRPFLTWSGNARTVKADAQDIVEAIRGLLRAEYLEPADMRNSCDALEGILHIVSCTLTVLEQARLQNQARASRGEDRPFDENDLAELTHLARRLAEHGPHLLAEIDALEARQNALWEAATSDASGAAQ